jgi:hypothetical protein
LPWRQHMTFRIHLLLCRDCRRYLDSYQKTRELIGSLRDETAHNGESPVPEELVQAILASCGRNSKPNTR